ncbi:MAG: hypothetical protein QG574_4750 [Cyanobacteriota bacterium erpe_2018_sw_21hr_WHONDRS-SW48-000092_B_bin.40]|jgi:hypothetical protein|nr:hypothetical protein [Cyanobacteriota bacterium erpe_2018_sw_21hr_WHONDRS-SW48-000092_B_bin.40]
MTMLLSTNFDNDPQKEHWDELLQTIELVERPSIQILKDSENPALKRSVKAIEEIRALFQLAKTLDYLSIPTPVIAQMKIAATSCRFAIESAVEYPHRKLPEAEYVALLTSTQESLQNSWQTAYNVVVPILTYNAISDDSFKDGLSGLANKAQSIESSMNLQSSMLLSKMQDTLQEIEDMAGKAGVSAFAANFAAERIRYEKDSWFWLKATIAIGGLLIGYVLWFLEPSVADIELTDWHSIFVLGITKLIILSVGSFLMLLCGRNYTAAKHNEVMNAHREVAITTFKSFMASTEDDNTKNAILSFACQAIFSVQPSGYLKNDAESVQNSQIVEIVKSLSGPVK